MTQFHCKNTKIDKCRGLQIDEVWPVRTKVCPNGGIGVCWSGDVGFGEFVLAWGKDGKLHADTEHMDREEDKRFTEAILKLLTAHIIIDD